METLFERPRGEPLPLPAALRARYGDLGFPPATGRPYVVANFVQTIDGIVSFGIAGRSRASLISRSNDDDRFVMGLLRACADVVLVGAGTVRVERPRAWSPESIHPASGREYAALRAALGKIEPPALRVVTSGPGGIRASADEIIDGAVAEGHRRFVLVEGGPNLFGQLLAAGRIDELFVTVAPQLAGRSKEAPRRGLVEELAFTPEQAPWAQLVSVKRAGDFLFHRYALGAPEAR